MYTKAPTRYSYPTLNFGAGAETYFLKGPKGKRGLLVDYGVQHPTATFTATTTAATVAVGTGADPDAYGEEFSLGTLAADAGTKSVMTDHARGSDGYNALVLPAKPIPADTLVALTCVSPTGGVPAGIAIPFVDIIWED